MLLINRVGREVPGLEEKAELPMAMGGMNACYAPTLPRAEETCLVDVSMREVSRCAWALALTSLAQPSHIECVTLTLTRGCPSSFGLQSPEIRPSQGRRT